jgi:hypothetical protein
MKLTDVIQLVQNQRLDFQREEDQALLQHDLHKAEMALAGKYACERILRAIGQYEGLQLVEPRTMSRGK